MIGFFMLCTLGFGACVLTLSLHQLLLVSVERHARRFVSSSRLLSTRWTTQTKGGSNTLSRLTSDENSLNFRPPGVLILKSRAGITLKANAKWNISNIHT